MKAASKVPNPRAPIALLPNPVKGSGSSSPLGRVIDSDHPKPLFTACLRPWRLEFQDIHGPLTARTTVRLFLRLSLDLAF